MSRFVSKALPAAAAASLLACILQIIGLIRYLGRLPEDVTGIVLYGVTIAAFLVAAIGFFVQWRKRSPED